MPRRKTPVDTPDTTPDMTPPAPVEKKKTTRRAKTEPVVAPAEPEAIATRKPRAKKAAPAPERVEAVLPDEPTAQPGPAKSRRRSKPAAEPAPQPVAQAPEPQADADGPDRAPRRSRTKRRKDLRDRDISAAAALSQPPAQVEPKPSSKPRARREVSLDLGDGAPLSEAPASVEAKPDRRGRRRREVDLDLPQVVSEEPRAEAAPTRPASKGRRRREVQLDLAQAEDQSPKPEQSPDKPAAKGRRRREVKLDLDFDVAPAQAEGDESDDGTTDERGRRRRRGRRGRRGKPGPMGLIDGVSEPEPGPEAPARRVRPAKVAEPEQPPIPVRQLVPVPEGAPQVVLRDGVPTLIRGHRVLPPLFFFGTSMDERRAENVLEQVRLAADAGVHLFTHLVDLVVDPGEVNDAVAYAGYLLNKTVQVDPQAQVLFRVVFTAPRGWENRYRKAAYVAESGGLAEPSVCDDEFWGVAQACLEDFARKMRMLDNRDHILGLHLERGEWFFAEGWGYDISAAAHEKFRDWLRTRYRDDIVALRAAWFDGQAQFQTPGVPEYDPDVRAGEEFVRTGRKARKWVDYHLFLSDVTVERIAGLAYAAKKASEGWFLIGASYGYTFEWSHPASGHLSLGKLLRTPEIDFIAGPPSYKNREPGGAAPFPGPIDSFALNGKLYLSEEDFKTPISGVQEPDDFNPVMKTPQALESVHWRGAGAALAHASGACWMDLWGNGWLATPGIWERGARVLESLVQRMGAPVAEPDVAVFIDERSLAYLVDRKAFALLVQNVRESVLRSGMSVGFYLLSDLAHRERFPESKLYVFMNAWDLRPEVRGAIKNRLQRDGKLLFWLYAAGLFEAGRDSLERVREVTGIALKPQPFAMKPGTAIRHRRHPLCEPLPEKTLSQGGTLEPSFFAIPEDGLVLGEYAQSGLPSYVAREFHVDGSPSLNWKSVFLGEPVVTPGLFRALGQSAGAHIWNYHEDVTHVRPPFLTVHCSGAGSRTIALPDRWAAYSLTHGQWAVTDATHLRFNANDGSTHVFLVGIQSEIEAMLSRDPAELMHMAQLPERPENTLALDALNFDVQIMKLDESLEDTWADDVAEDLLLRPSQLEIESDETEAPAADDPSRRKRRRRGGRSRSDRPEEPKEAASSATKPKRRGRSEGPKPDGAGFDDLGMNVLFRKRE